MGVGVSVFLFVESCEGIQTSCLAEIFLVTETVKKFIYCICITKFYTKLRLIKLYNACNKENNTNHEHRNPNHRQFTVKYNTDYEQNNPNY